MGHGRPAQCTHAARGAAGLAVGRKEQGLVFHDTRRCARTNLSAADVPDVVARSITGHRTASMETRYNITQETRDRRVPLAWRHSPGSDLVN